MIFIDGSKFEGEWQEDKMHGAGAYTSAEGQRNVGTWNDGKRVR